MDNLNAEAQYIEEYLRNELTTPKRKEFESRLKTDAAFNGLYERYLGFEKLVSENHTKDLKSFLKNVESKGLSEPKSVNKGNKKTSGIKKLVLAAIVLGLVFLAFYFFQQTGSSVSQQDLFVEYFNPYPNTLASIERGSADMDALETAMLLYTNKDFSQAVERFDLLLNEKNPDSRIEFYKAVSLAELDDLPRAIELLEKLKSNSSFAMIPEARWYLALFYIKQNEIQKSISLLNEILETNQVYQKTNATELLDILSHRD